MNFNLNLQGAQEIGNYMQPGQYSVKIKNFEAKESKNGHPQIAITFSHKEEGEFTHFANGDTSNDFAKNWLFTFLKAVDVQGNNGQFSFTERDVIGKPINIELKREYNDYTEKWNTVLKRFWKFEGTAVFEKYEIKEEQKNNNTSTSSNNSNSDNPFANANGPIDIDESDLPF
ncbi:DUF669 domain-containing protein [Staphylococcus gallinarum]|uniref:Single-strand DNA-binding protein n=1 Tax=Staphylococcus gallinarum TaxID=1293 RepID=A0ABQ0XYS7_STAGA|nr:hypothetical protein [Staphylococcus gallinarum]KIR10648.1 hypothetical protein SH09_10790 [Staphylococcus gallinarum]RTX82852.1 DUF669 domain-containing protein [Staphylococcus gallinarum]GEQ04534.1 single-strand DNA-binding protein [Staphylococcus gallinarum]